LFGKGVLHVSFGKPNNYDKHPFVNITGRPNEAWEGYGEIINEITRKLSQISKQKKVIAIECYPGFYEEDILTVINGIENNMVINADDISFAGEKITSMIDRNLTDDRVFGVLSCHRLEEFFDQDKLVGIRDSINSVTDGTVMIYGTGASLVYEADVLIYADLARWEIQQRYRKGDIDNWRADNHSEDVLRKYKRAFFIEWRMADRHKKQLFEKIDYLLDTNKRKQPKMITGDALRTGLMETARRPFRVVPYFDQGVWGGQWLKEVMDLDQEVDNYAWGFDCVPEENSLYLRFGEIQVEIPSINVVLYQPRELLGERVHARFGAEFPIRFDFLDTIEGQNLSLQVHPLTEYIQENFGMHYTQDESYYILDAKEDATVYLGLKNGVNKDALIVDLQGAQENNTVFPAENYVNQYPAQKHDHFLIPAGTIHCSGENCVVLEISATPYIFTFKLYDWGRLGLDGLPRPIHLEHGKHNIQWNVNKDWTDQNLVNRIEVVGEGDGWIEEKTGLHEREFIETRRHWFTNSVTHHTNGSVNVLNLIEGDEAIVTSPTNQFEPYVIHYAETFIVPAAVGEYHITPYGKSEGKRIGTIKAYVR
jgi:mannose-6-phosphate isomerase class I